MARICFNCLRVNGSVMARMIAVNKMIARPI